jgi:Undecaprenyl-phosphate glucose phosphotransferase
MKFATALETDQRAAQPLTLGVAGLTLTLVAADVLAVAAIGTLSGALYHYVGYGTLGAVQRYFGIGILAGLVYVTPRLYGGDYLLARLIDNSEPSRRIIAAWVQAFVFLLIAGFLTKTSAHFSRAALGIFFIAGLVTTLAVHKLASRAARRGLCAGYIASRRVLLVGADGDIAPAINRISDIERGLVVCGCMPLDLSDPQAVEGVDWSEAVARARALRADDIVILSGFAGSSAIERVTRAFLVLPAAVHVTAGDALGSFRNARLSRLGAEPTICLTEQPLGPMQSMAKRLFDIVVAGIALVMLSPVLAGIAVLIRRETPGPALFLQRRRGFNQEEFRIWKFRTMTTLDDGEIVPQAVKGDARITRMGAWLRRYNLDELPQLMNVLKGEMSIVGPRPHAVSHDRHYEARIATYPRRLNVKPGLTGWAQIHGLRGPTLGEGEMEARVAHDLHYIDNWSMSLDLYIIAMTVVSPQAYRNAH